MMEELVQTGFGVGGRKSQDHRYGNGGDGRMGQMEMSVWLSLLRKTLSIPPRLRMRRAWKRYGEYTRAILLNGPDGQTFTAAAVRLEGEAYQRGYYKAFALTALVPGGGRPVRRRLRPRSWLLDLTLRSDPGSGESR